MKLFVNVQERNMSVWSAVILVLLGAFIHGSFALKCFKCEGVTEGGPCGTGPAEPKGTGVEEQDCSGTDTHCLLKITSASGMQFISYVAKR